MWIVGALFVIYHMHEHLRKVTFKRIFKEYLMLFFCFFMGFIILWKAKIRTIVFDKQNGTMTVKKKNTFCDNRSIVTYRLRDITDVRAVQRGYRT